MKKVILILSILCFNLVAQAQDKLISTEVKDHIKERVDKGVNVGIVVGMIDNGKVEYFSYGSTALENGSDVNENSVFEIGSISKTFTTIMIADLMTRGKIKLSDPVYKLLPDNVTMPSRNGKVITVLDLATHTSAIPRMPNNFTPTNPNNPYADYTIKLAYEYLAGLELTRDIGERYEYSNIGMGMLGHVLEIQYGKSYEEILIERIADPYDMDNTRVTFTKQMSKHLAFGHSNGQQVENWDLPALAGAGAIRSTATDMVKYLKANMGLTEGPLSEAMEYTHKTAYSNEEQNFSIGMAWHFSNDGKIVWHNGGTGGYISFAGFDKATGKGAVVLTNTTENINDIGFYLLNAPVKLEMPKVSIATAMDKIIAEKGIEGGLAFYKEMKHSNSKIYDFGEGELNRLGYKYMVDKKDLRTALILFKHNVQMFPKASNPYDSLGEALLKKGDSVGAITNYTKSLELNPANDNAKTVLRTLDVDISDIVKEVAVSEKTLENYVGTYELMPEFTITVTREGKQLIGQGTGQPPFKMYASSETEFYLKDVPARVVFNANDNGVIDSLTLFQGGQELKGKKAN